MHEANGISRRHVLLAPLLVPLANTVSAADPSGRLATPGKILVAYFSRTGNTRVVAGQIQRALGADLFEILPATSYPEDYAQTVEQARRERDNNVRPALKSGVPRIADYQTIYLGFPIWGETAPPVIRSFLASHDLAEKTLIPFITHGGYGVGSSMDVLSAHAPRARLTDAAFVMQGEQEKQTLERVSGWLGKIGAGKARAG
ncbi:flavodoxin [Pseudoduganella umbonata]|uniref:Flavodoxin n=1 Tax=Pseudoduganella umbonata TaxID=864828 RepID=A0A4P8HL62_9BURK|nr:flavodoxin [Pseudoduganella umbonata]MBB3221659.1 flavodoxin [Pseudoduganella umbonata]QCP09114.1 flavodoxin [Pseudoduganella umbonata]